jgi:hypothetical protein
MLEDIFGCYNIKKFASFTTVKVALASAELRERNESLAVATVAARWRQDRKRASAKGKRHFGSAGVAQRRRRCRHRKETPARGRLPLRQGRRSTGAPSFRVGGGVSSARRPCGRRRRRWRPPPAPPTPRWTSRKQAGETWKKWAVGAKIKGNLPFFLLQ